MSINARGGPVDVSFEIEAASIDALEFGITAIAKEFFGEHPWSITSCRVTSCVKTTDGTTPLWTADVELHSWIGPAREP